MNYSIEGIENLPEQPFLIASGQQSTWENIAFPVLFGNPTIWVKSELYMIPAVGRVARANEYIRTERSGDPKAARAGVRQARDLFRKGRSILIFAEGTRNTTPGEANLKKGAGVLYALLECRCVPVVVNSGLYWSRGSHIIRPGTVRVQILRPIEPGLPRAEFEARLKRDLDEASLRLRGSSEPSDSKG